MKKIILTLSGVLFVIVTGCSLLICMMHGIPNLDQPAAAFYLAKAILLSFSLPLVTLGLFVHCLQLRRKLDKKNLSVLCLCRRFRSQRRRSEGLAGFY